MLSIPKINKQINILKTPSTTIRFLCPTHVGEQVGEAKTATLLIIAPEEARRASTTFAIDTKHPSPPGLEADISGEVSLAPGQV